MGLFDETSNTTAKPESERMGKGRESLFEWLIKRAESDLGLAQAFALGETERADQIKRLESTLVGEINDLRHHLLEGRAAELDGLKSEIFVFTDKMARIEASKAPSAAVKDFVQHELGALQTNVNERQVRLEGQQAGLQKLGDALGAQIRVLEEQIREKSDRLRSAQGEMRDLKSEAQNLTQRVTQTESIAWQTKSFATRTAQQCEQTAEVVRQELASIKTELNIADSRFNEMRHGLDAQFDDIRICLSRDTEAIQGHETSIGRLDIALADLTKQFADAETLTRKIHAIVQQDAQSTSEIHQAFDAKLHALNAVLDEAAARETNLKDLEGTIRDQIEEFRRKMTQTYADLERRDFELERSLRGVEEDLVARIAKQEENLRDSLRTLAINEDELRQFKPELQSIVQQINRLESAGERAQTQSDANTNRIEELAGNFFGEIAALKANIGEQREHFRLPDDQIRDIENRLDAKVGALERQFATEREGFEHWEKGLRQSFGSQLSAIHARISERQSQLEHRHAHFDRLEENLMVKFGALESQLTERLRNFDSSDHRWGEFSSEIQALAARTDRLECMEGESQASIVTSREHVEHSIASLKSEILALRDQLQNVSTQRGETVVRGLEESFESKLQAVRHDTESKLNTFDARDIERVQQTEALVNNLKTEFEALKTVIDVKQNDTSAPGTVTQLIQDTLNSTLNEIDRKLAEQFSLLDGRDTERAQQAQIIIDSLQNEITALKSSFGSDAAAWEKSAVESLEKSIIAQSQELREQLEQKAILLDRRDAELSQQLKQAFDGLSAELNGVKAELHRQPEAVASFDPALRGLEENLSAKIYGLSQHVAQKFSSLDKRDAELQELKERSQSLIHRVAQLSSTVQALQKTGPSAAPPLAPLPNDMAEKAPEANAAEEQSATATRYSSEKEQLIKLQERMSSEIERVRAELKERSGRWKMRKSAS